MHKWTCILYVVHPDAIIVLLYCFSLSAQLYFIGVVKVHAVFSPMEIFLALHGTTLWSKSTWLTVVPCHQPWLICVASVMHRCIRGEDELLYHQETRSRDAVLRPHTNPWRKEEIIRARRSEACKYYFPSGCKNNSTPPWCDARAAHPQAPNQPYPSAFA